MEFLKIILLFLLVYKKQLFFKSFIRFFKECQKLLISNIIIFLSIRPSWFKDINSKTSSKVPNPPCNTIKKSDFLDL